jgi:hypothetical protein
MDKEIFNTCLSFIKILDNYIREIDIKNIDEYEDFFPFINESDISLYKDIEKSVIIQYTIGIFLNSKLDIENRDNILYIFIVSYILSVKYITDCAIYKPYSFIIDFIEEFEIDNVRELLTREREEEQKEKKRYKKDTNYMRKMMGIERRILYNNDFFSKNEI